MKKIATMILFSGFILTAYLCVINEKDVEDIMDNAVETEFFAIGNHGMIIKIYKLGNE